LSSSASSNLDLSLSSFTYENQSGQVTVWEKKYSKSVFLGKHRAVHMFTTNGRIGKYNSSISNDLLYCLENWPSIFRTENHLWLQSSNFFSQILVWHIRTGRVWWW
jgi:hypothetical protein